MTQGKITIRRQETIRTYTCTCKTPMCEADEWGVMCIYEPKYGMFGCGASKKW